MPNEDSAGTPKIPPPDVDWIYPEQALASLGKYIDACFRADDRRGTRAALSLIHGANTIDWSADFRGQLHYFESNVWADLRDPSWDKKEAGWPWDSPEVEGQILSLRKAILSGLSTKVTPPWMPMAWTNLGNAMDHVGRPIEALEAWTQALDLDNRRAMARGNRGMGFVNFGKALHDNHYKILFLAAAHRDLTEAMSDIKHLEPEAQATFSGLLASLDRFFGGKPAADVLATPDFPLGDSEEERSYRRWCLDNRLCLNPLNDLDTWTVASHDVLTLPTITSKDFQPEEWIALFNQIKQEFASARYLIYDGFKSTEPHFSDRGVRLVNPLDYSTYSLASEKVKAGYRMAYSLFDKIAFLLNDYLELGLSDRHVSWKTIWYEKGKKEKGLRPKFRGRANRALRGLYWLSKDLYEDTPGFQEALLPDARDLADIRHHTEHKLLRLQDPIGAAVAEARPFPEPPRGRRLGYSLTYDVFKTRALRLLKTARAGVMYLSLAIGEEESAETARFDPRTPAVPMITDIFEDHWKRPPA